MTGGAGMTVSAGIGGEIVVHALHILNRTVPPPVMIAGAAACIVDIGVAAIAGQHVVIIEHGHIRIAITGQPVVDQPFVESSGIGGTSRRRLGVFGIFTFVQRRGGDDNEEFILPGGKICQKAVIDGLRVGNR